MNVKTTASALIIRSLPRVDASTDTGARLIHGQVAKVYGRSLDGAWLFVEAPAGTGWASSAFLEEHVGGYVQPTWPKVPHGLHAIRQQFGEPGNPDATRGIVVLPARIPIGWDRSQHVTRFNCHIKLQDVLTSVFNEIWRRNLWHLLEDFGGCYNFRAKRTATTKYSTHSWGIAVDINTASNPLGKKPVLDRRIVGIFDDHGFFWGGHWSQPDGMHFQYATGY